LEAVTELGSGGLHFAVYLELFARLDNYTTTTTKDRLK
jgi:hypothetical protein